MTKYILHGGETKLDCEWNTKFFQEMVRGVDSPRILALFQAVPVDGRPARIEKLKQKLEDANPGMAYSLAIASENPKTLADQLEHANVVYLHGGDTQALFTSISQVPNLKERLNGKIVAGSSAGAYVLAAAYFSNSRRVVDRGLGILPIKIFAHWDESQQTELAELRAFGEELPIVLIPETEYIVIEQ